MIKDNTQQTNPLLDKQIRKDRQNPYIQDVTPHHGAQSDGDKVPDWRHISNGREIPTISYSDQPYIVKTDDGHWLCTVTTGSSHEGSPGQHVITFRSSDQGHTWTDPVAVEPAEGPEASYAVLYKTSYGRIYVFYNHNTDNLRQCIADNPPYKTGFCTRVDSLGHYVFRYSDDHGRSWSDKRYEVPIRMMEIDRTNPYQGAVRFFWNVGKPFTYDDVMFLPHHKVGRIGNGFFVTSEGVFLTSTNINQERNPEKLLWETLPEGETGLRTPPGGGPVAEEQSATYLSDGSLFVVYRTIDGHPACSYSRDHGRTWEQPQYMQYGDGRLMKHPRAANFVWKCTNGKYLYWFHNHGGCWYEDRNPVWLCAGEETDSPEGRRIRWSQPEILLYDDDPYIRMSYPDYLEDDGKHYVTETQKDIARVHEIPEDFLSKLFNQFDYILSCPNDILMEAVINDHQASISMPQLLSFTQRDQTKPDYRSRNLRSGFTLEFWLDCPAGEPDGDPVLADARDNQGKGISLRFLKGGILEFIMSDGQNVVLWSSDPGMIQLGQMNHAAIVVDGGPGIISFIINGVLCDGGLSRQFGWGRFNQMMKDVNGSDFLIINNSGTLQISRIRIYGKALLVTDIIGNYRAENRQEFKRRLSDA